MASPKVVHPSRDTGFVKTLPDEQLECRTIRHQWELEYFGPAAKADPPAEGQWANTNIRRTRCRRCWCTREEFFNEIQTFKFLNGDPFMCFYRRYYYPQGYLYRAKADLDRPESKDYHYELYLRQW